MDSWSPASFHNEDHGSTSHKPATYLIVKMQAGHTDYSSSSKEVHKYLPENAKADIEKALQLADKDSYANQGNSYEFMLREAEALHQRDPNPEDVKDLRKYLPILRKVCYLTPEEIEKKIKLKCMWTDRPSDWPREVPHVDPNNPGCGSKGGPKTPKPKKPDLVKMFQFLAKKYKTVRQQLWQDTFGISPDADVPVSSSVVYCKPVTTSIRDLADSINQIYQNRNLEKMLRALIEATEKTDGLEDPAVWCKYNRQRSVLEADLREGLHLNKLGSPHSANDFCLELGNICTNLGITQEDIDRMVDDEETNVGLPVVLEEARSPSTPAPGRKRKPTFNLDMSCQVPTVAVPELGLHSSQPMVEGEDADFVMDTMNVAQIEEVSTDDAFDEEAFQHQVFHEDVFESLGNGRATLEPFESRMGNAETLMTDVFSVTGSHQFEDQPTHVQHFLGERGPFVKSPDPEKKPHFNQCLELDHSQQDNNANSPWQPVLADDPKLVNTTMDIGLEELLIEVGIKLENADCSQVPQPNTAVTFEDIERVLFNDPMMNGLGEPHYAY